LQKKAFSIEISKNNAHTLPFHFTWSVKTTQKLFRSFLIHNKRYSELLSVFDLLFQFEIKPSNSSLFSWDVWVFPKLALVGGEAYFLIEQLNKDEFFFFQKNVQKTRNSLQGATKRLK